MNQMLLTCAATAGTSALLPTSPFECGKADPSGRSALVTAANVECNDVARVLNHAIAEIVGPPASAAQPVGVNDIGCAFGSSLYYSANSKADCDATVSLRRDTTTPCITHAVTSASTSPGSNLLGPSAKH